MKLGLGLVLLAGCNLYFGSNHGGDDSPPNWGGVAPDATSWRPDAELPPFPDAAVPADAEVIPAGLLPVAPSATEFMWQGVQEHFKTNGVDCHGQVTAAVSDHAVCYVGADDDVHCSGATYTQTYGAFHALGKIGVDQILLSMTYNSQNGNSICVHERNNTIDCFGANNDWGNFGNGSIANSDTWTTYGAGHGWKRLVGFAQIYCGVDDVNDVYCAGYQFGATPVKVGNGTSVYLDYTGAPHINDSSVWRAGSSSSYCILQPGGLLCSEPNTVISGVGNVVDGSEMNGAGPGDTPACYLDDIGGVRCTVAEITERQFTARPNVALAGSYYTDTHCAVGNDGSLWCRGTNHNGELGSLSISPYVDTRVQPPGSVKVTCN